MGMRGNFEEGYSGISIKVRILQVYGFLIKQGLAGGKMAILNILAK